MALKKRRLGDLLVDWGVIAPDSVEAALEYGGKHGIRIGEAQLDDARGGRHRSRRAHEQLVACVRQRCGERREVSRRRG